MNTSKSLPQTTSKITTEDGKTETASSENLTLLRLTTDIVVAQIQHSSLSGGNDSLPELIKSVYHALSSAEGPAPATPPVRPAPAVPIKRSVFPDYIICLEDGKKLKMLKRHLQSSYGMTPAEYRERWGLPSDYPLVAPNYATRRSELARRIGLGRKAAEEIAVEPEIAPQPAAGPAPKKRPTTRAKKA